MEITAAEQIEMIEDVIEIIECFADGVTRIKWIYLAVSRIKNSGEPTKKFGHGDIRLAIAIIWSRVEQHRLARAVKIVITAPQVTVQ